MFATIYLPNFYLQAATRHEPELRDQPIALLDDEQNKAILCQLNSAAEQAGVAVGMTASQGLARCLSLIIKTRQRAQEKLLDKMLEQLAGSLAPYLEATAPGICTVQFTDSRDLPAKTRRVIDQLAVAEIVAQAGIAATPDTSLLAAHLARPVLAVMDTRKFLADLPLETLLLA